MVLKRTDEFRQDGCVSIDQWADCMQVTDDLGVSMSTLKKWIMANARHRRGMQTRI